MAIIILAVYFKFLPDLIKLIPEASSFQPGQIKSRFSAVIIAYFIVVPLLNLYVWKKEKQFSKEETDTRKAFDFNPNDAVAKEKLEKLEKKRKRFFNIIEPITIIIFGGVTAFVAWSFMVPIFELTKMSAPIP